jgi:hypothetical protein
LRRKYFLKITTSLFPEVEDERHNGGHEGEDEEDGREDESQRRRGPDPVAHGHQDREVDRRREPGQPRPLEPQDTLESML